MSYIVLGSNSNHQVQAFGTMTGRPFESEEAANGMAKKLDRKYGHVDFIVLNVTPALDYLQDNE